MQMAEAYAYHRERIGASPELYHPETLRRIRSGEKISKETYLKALRGLEEGRKEIAKVKKVFDGIDDLIMPTTPIPAPRISDLMKDPAKLRPAELAPPQYSLGKCSGGCLRFQCLAGSGGRASYWVADRRLTAARSLVLRIAHAYERARLMP